MTGLTLNAPPPDRENLLPYGRQTIDEGDVAAVAEVLGSAWLTQGPQVEIFEKALADTVGARHAVAVSSGTAALHLAYLALGVGPGDVVVTSPVTFAATANAAVYCGAAPGFADVCAHTICLNPEALESALAEGLRPKLVVPVHYGGLPCDLDALAKLAARFGFQLVEDACHALGAGYRFDGRWGAVGDCRASAAAVFSFHPVKHITTGEGGAVVTNDERVARRVRTLRSHGMAREHFRVQEQATGACREERPWYYEMQELGFNYRLTDLQCALGSSQLAKLDGFVARRRQLASWYDERLAGLEHAGALLRPVGSPDGRSSRHLYAVRIPGRRDESYLELRRRGIGTQVHYLPVHLHPYYRERFCTRPGSFPEAEKFFEQALSLPLFPAMGEDDVSRVCAALQDVLGPS